MEDQEMVENERKFIGSRNTISEPSQANHPNDLDNNCNIAFNNDLNYLGQDSSWLPSISDHTSQNHESLSAPHQTFVASLLQYRLPSMTCGG